MRETSAPPDAQPWTWFPGKTLREIEQAAIRSAYFRHGGNRMRMMRELGIAKSTLMRHLRRLGLASPRASQVRHLREIDIARAFQKHRGAIVAELKIKDSTLMGWLEKRLPALLEGTR